MNGYILDFSDLLGAIDILKLFFDAPVALLSF